MNNQFNVTIKTPCTENFDLFSPTKKGGFCDACQKEVIDFTHMNAAQIATYFKTNDTKNTCGRFKKQQLKTYSFTAHKRKKLSFISGLGLAFLTFFSFGKMHGQEISNITYTPEQNGTKIQDTTNPKRITVKGTVAEDGNPLPGASVVLEGTTIGVSTDFDGNFEFPEKLKKGDVLVISYVGFNSKKVVIQNQNSAAQVIMDVNLNIDSCTLLGKIAVNKVYSSKRN